MTQLPTPIPPATPMPADHPETRVVESQALADRCLAFVEEQSCGEWGAEIERADAVKLFHFLEDEIARHRLRSTDQQGMLREADRLSDILDTERYKVAIALQGIKRAIDGRRWLSEPGRGSYTYDDERYQAEFGQALDEIDEALKPLRKIASDWSDCPRDPLRVAANRSAALTGSEAR